MLKMTLQLHLNKSGSGMSSMTACGRNILRTPMSTNWGEFKSQKTNRCTKCVESKLFAFLTRQDAKKEPIVVDDWVAADPDAWKAEDDKIIAAHKLKKK